MKLYFLFIIIFIQTLSYSNNLRQILTTNELDLLTKGFEIFKYTDNFNDLISYEGELRIKLINGKLKYCMIGNWTSFYDSTKNIKSDFEFDSIGCLLTYNEFTADGFNEYNCVYEKKRIRNNDYLIETVQYFYENNHIYISGQRAKQYDLKFEYFHPTSKFKRIGIWITYNDNGTILKEKKYKELIKIE